MQQRATASVRAVVGGDQAAAAERFDFESEEDLFFDVRSTETETSVTEHRASFQRF